jgi:hypothetical protein
MGEGFVDHQSFFIFKGPLSHVHRSSFEIHDFDIQALYCGIRDTRTAGVLEGMLVAAKSSIIGLIPLDLF